MIELPFRVPAFRLAMAWHPRAQNDPSGIWIRQRFLALRGDGAAAA